MENQSNAGLAIPPIAWAAAIAVIAFSLGAIVVLMGWLPGSGGSAGTRPVPEARPSRLVLPAMPEARVPPAAPVRQAEAAPRRPAAHATPVKPATAVTAAARCDKCGVIESIREIVAGNGSAGPGASGDAFPGTEFDKRPSPAKVYAVTVRLDDGTSRVVSESAAPHRHAGDKVRIVNGAIESDV